MKQLLLLTFSIITYAIQAQSYMLAAPHPDFANVRDGAVAFGDIDNDGDQDLIVTGSSPTAVVANMYENDGGTFTLIPNTPFEGVSNSNVAFSDLDNDGDLDLLITGRLISGSRVFQIYDNDGGNFIDTETTTFAGLRVDEFSLADVDGDNDQDLILTAINSGGEPVTRLYFNNAGTFVISPNSLVGVTFATTAFADIDGDNDMDLFVAGQANGFYDASLYLNNNGNFTKVDNTPFTAVINGDAAFADVDGDNLPDLISTGENGSGVSVSELYKNNGDGTFALVSDTPFVGAWRSSVAFADVNNDDEQDLIIAGEDSNTGELHTTLYINSDGSFSALADNPFMPVWIGDIAFADVDGDNDLDLLISGEDDNSVQSTRLYINGDPTSTEELDAEISIEFVTYPNPIRSGIVNVDYRAETNNEIALKIYAQDGRLVKEAYRSVSIGDNNLKINIDGLSVGLYVLEIKDDLKIGSTRFVVER